MKIKKYEAFEVSEALRAIREELGPDAVILSTREINQNEYGMPLRRGVEVTAAVEFSAPIKQKTESVQSKFSQIFNEVIPKIEKGEEILSIRDELRSIKVSIQSLQEANRLESNQFYARLYEVCNEMKSLVSGQQIQNSLVHMNESLIRLYVRLLSNGVDPQTSISLVNLMQEKLSPSDLRKEDFIRTYLEEMIKGMVQKISGLSKREEETSPVIALVGPAGVGKTTTLVKLASKKVMENQNVTLATLDTSRIGAVDQLRAYGKIIGVPVYVASSVGDLKGLVARRKKGDWILVDTPGRSHRNSRQMVELNELKNIGIPMETHLVLSAHTKEDDLDEMIDGFSSVSIDRFIFTKTDETKCFGPLLTMMRKKKRSISYLTMGQRVPEDIEVATPKRVTELILN